MFNDLVESGSHKADVKRKSSFLLGTLALYAVLLLIAAVGSIYAYDVHLETEDLVFVMVAPPSVDEPVPAPSSRTEPRPVVNVVAKVETAVRTDRVADTMTPNLVPKEVSSKSSTVPPLPPGGDRKSVV